jgi:hypothetical protein
LCTWDGIDRRANFKLVACLVPSQKPLTVTDSFQVTICGVGFETPEVAASFGILLLVQRMRG